MRLLLIATMLALPCVVGCGSKPTSERPTSYGPAPKSDNATAAPGGAAQGGSDAGGAAAAPPPPPPPPPPQ
ncbi:MAG: hypothetical protein U0905_03190 [Pirellulales bacterium]